MAASVKRSAHDWAARQRSADVLPADGLDFGSLLLSPAVLEGLAAAGFQRPSPIQLQAIPLGRCGLDLIVQAKSGTGKTCVFCTVALDSLVLENPATQVLVLAPTREIAVQIHSVLLAIGSAMQGLQCHVFIGGRAVSQDKAHLKRCHVAVGSPGRIKQLMELGLLTTSSIRLFVLDEADKLLEEGSFQEQINWIFSSLPENKQMLALSATYPESLAQHLTRYMREPTFVRLNPTDMALKGLKQYYKLVQSHPLPHKVFEEKVQHLLELFGKIPFNQALVFSNLHTRAQHLADILCSKGLPAVCISGGLTQDQRLEAMSKLKQYQCRVLISTDLTARGIDADKVNLVVNLDVPHDWETYLHRIGRAGRFGTQGLAVTYCCHGDEENQMMAVAQKCNLTLLPLPSLLEASLMEEPCDWAVCAEAAAARPLALHPSSRTERGKKKKKEKVLEQQQEEEEQLVENHQDQRKPVRTRPAPAVAGNGCRVSAVPAGGVTPPREAVPTRKQLQEALPRIPPLSSFKSRDGGGLVGLEQAEQDFYHFITAGAGRSVEVVREFRGHDGEEGDREGEEEVEGSRRETVTLHDDSSHSAKRLASWCQSDCGPGPTPTSPRPTPTSSGPEDTAPQEELARSAVGGEVGGAASVRPGHPQPRGLSNGRASCRPAPQEPAPAGKLSSRTSSSQSRKSVGKEKEQTGGGTIRGRRGGAWRRGVRHYDDEGKSEEEEEQQEQQEEEEEEDEESWSPEAYWRSYYRAWRGHCSSASPPAGQLDHYSYYSAAHQWMAAYRMNAVYMQELLRF